MIFPLQSFDYTCSGLKNLFEQFESIERNNECAKTHDEIMQHDKNLFSMVTDVLHGDGTITKDSLFHLQLLEISWVYEYVHNVPECEISNTLKTYYYAEFMSLFTEVQFVYDNILLLLAKSGTYKIRDVSLEYLGGNILCLGVEF